MESLTFTLNGTTSTLDAHFWPAIDLDPRKTYVIGLVKFISYNSIPNIDSANNKLYVGGKQFEIPIGSYEIKDLNQYLREELGININLTPNNNTLRCKLWSEKQIDFTKATTFNELLGFSPQILKANRIYESDRPVRISNVNAIRVECNVVSGAYLNNKLSHTLHEFAVDIPPGFRLLDTPSTITYIPINQNLIEHLQCRIVDQDGRLVNFRGETITIRLHVKSI